MLLALFFDLITDKVVAPLSPICDPGSLLPVEGTLYQPEEGSVVLLQVGA